MVTTGIVQAAIVTQCTAELPAGSGSVTAATVRRAPCQPHKNVSVQAVLHVLPQ